MRAERMRPVQGRFILGRSTRRASRKVQLSAGACLSHKPTDSGGTSSLPLIFHRLILPLLGLALAAGSSPSVAAQTPNQPAGAASASQAPAHAPSLERLQPSPLQPADPCEVKNTGASIAATGAMRAFAALQLSDTSSSAGATPVITRVCMPHLPMINWYARFLSGPEVKPMTPDEKAWLAVHNLLDPFNLITITGEAAISVAANSHSSYGPGFPGWGRYVGVSFTQDMTGEFFGTYLIPSLVHQDPHYHREPDATIRHRISHAALQVLWTQGDNGHSMVNWANIAGFAIDDEIGNLYVPGQATRASATASRYFIGLGTAPIDNYVIEFLPDVARHIHIQIVVIQRVINQVARNDSTAP